jgi:hypothetical protein
MDLLDISNSVNEQGEYRGNIESIFKNNWDIILKDRKFNNILINRKWAILDLLKQQNLLRKVLDKSWGLIQKELKKINGKIL